MTTSRSPPSPTACASPPTRCETVETGLARRLGRRRHAPRAGRDQRRRASARAHGVQGHRAAHAPAPSPRRSRRSAATSTPIPAREITAYYAKVLKEDVPLALDILADILQHSMFDPDELERERARHPAGDRPGPRHARRHHLRPFPGARLSRPGRSAGRCWARPRSSAACRARPCRAIMREHYSARAAWCCRRPARSSTTASSIWRQALSATCRARGRRRREPARYVGGDCREARDLEQVHLVLGFPGIGYRRSRLLRRSRSIRPLFGGGMSSRLFQEIREKRGLVYAHPLLRHRLSPTAGCSASMPAPARTRWPSWCRLVCEEFVKRRPTRIEAEELRARRAPRSRPAS